MTTFMTILDIACGRPIPREDAGPARRLQLVVLAFLASLVFAAAWGAAAGSQATGLAPAGLLAWRLSGAQVRGSDLALGFSGGVFGGTLVLAVLAPIVALYYHSSAWGGPMLGIGSALLALLTGTIMFVRGTIKRAPEGASKLATLIPILVTLAMQVLTLLQLAAIAAPIFPEHTPFSGGIDHFVQ
jgi:hypothetical protein